MTESTKTDENHSLSVEDKLGLFDFDWDENQFITVDHDLCVKCNDKPCLYVCPSKVYQLNDDKIVYNIEGCIELGMCTVVCDKIGNGAITWNYPRGGKGVSFNYG